MNLFRPTASAFIIKLVVRLTALALPGLSAAMGLMLEPAPAHCGKAVLTAEVTLPAAAQRLAGSKVSQGQRDISWAWLGSPTVRYPHAALGSGTHAGSVHVLVATPSGAQQEVVYNLPINRVFEDLTLRLADLDQDGRDEIIVIESDAVRGSSVVVLGLHNGNTLKELARSPPTGSTFRWLNPVGVADFDGDGKQDIAAVITPHIGGELTLYHYRPPQLVPYAKAMDTSNHLMGSPEQQLAVIMQLPGLRPTIIVPDMSLKALHALRWENSDRAGEAGKWKELADVMPLPARIERITLMAGAQSVACVLLADATWRRVTLTETH